MPQLREKGRFFHQLTGGLESEVVGALERLLLRRSLGKVARAVV